jgi:DNA helicase-2/ATP-dependent DNA helicase PcrA
MLKSFAKEPMKQLNEEIVEERYEEMENDLKEKRFLGELFSPNLKFEDVLMFYEYEDEDGKFATMHKTKGTGIENVLVVLDEYGWGEYDFFSCFSGEPPASSKEASTRKLLYVACSRAKKNLICVRLAQDKAEAARIVGFFPNAEEVPINLLSYGQRGIDADAA